MTRAAATPKADLVFEQVINARDLGGIETQDGRRVGAHRLYRTGHLCRPSAADLAMLDSLGIGLVYDLRSNAERAAAPSRLGAESIARRQHRDYDYSGVDLVRIMRQPDVSAEELTKMMLGRYRDLPREQEQPIRAIAQAFVAGELPILFHCAAGKDRTGVVAALLLELLGVSRAAIEADYLLSNDAFAANRAGLLDHIRRTDVDDAVWDPILRVEPHYLQEMFDTVDRGGGVIAYFDRLGIDAAMRDAIRERLLEPVGPPTQNSAVRPR